MLKKKRINVDVNAPFPGNIKILLPGQLAHGSHLRVKC